MPAIRGITVAVGDWYARTLEICLIRNMRHLTSCLVVTAPGDPSADVARAVPGVSVHETDKFFLHGARFNKGLAMESGFDAMGRDGLLAIIDADVLLPDTIPLDQVRADCLHGCRRRVLEDPSKWHPGFDWNTAPQSRDGGPIGFLQIFSASDPAVRDKRPWYDVSFAHAGGGDAYFMGHWPPGKRKLLAMDVLHLGPTDTNWMGTDPAARDLMAKFVTENGWQRAAAKFTPEQAARAGELVERVEVPGYEKSTFELPFVRRAQERRRLGTP